jgi:UDP-N-acetylmuramyl pentapeptide phosphotransferase/UDP-N-acetylglucosamine-1-phosphate transferase
VKEIIVGFLTSFLVVLVTTPSLIKVAKLKQLVDIPGEDRKLHSRRVPTIGGIIIFASILFAFSLWLPAGPKVSCDILLERSIDLKYLTSSLIILFFIGVKDDIIGVSPMKKLLSLTLVGFILVIMGDFRITNFDGLLGLYEIPYWASVFLSFFVYIVIVNAFNLIDVVDGLAASQGFIIAVFFAVWYYLLGNETLVLLSAVLAGALLGFLFFNFSPAKIFMGDSGSMTIGVIVSLLAIWLIGKDNSLMVFPFDQIRTPLAAMTLLSYPLTDTIRVFTIRAFKGLSPFAADKNHIHHKMLANGLNHKQIVFSVMIYSIFMVFMLVLTSGLEPNLALLLLLVFNAILIFLLMKIKGRHAKSS